MKNKKQYIVAVDGGGSKTLAVLCDLNGKIIKKARYGCSNFAKIGIDKAVNNIVLAIEEALNYDKDIEVVSTCVSLAGIEESAKVKDIILKKLALCPKISKIFKHKFMIQSDQFAGFCSGTDIKDGIVLIAGTGCVAHGWKNKKQARANGWGWLCDEGSSFYIGQKALKSVFKDLDKRGEKTKITNMILKKFNVKTPEQLYEKIYIKGNAKKIIPYFSILVNKAGEKKDKIACFILEQAGKELALSANMVIKKLNFQKQEFPLVLIGSLFKSKIVLEIVKKEIKKFAPKVKFIIPQKEPITGVIKIAIKNMNYL